MRLYETSAGQQAIHLRQFLSHLLNSFQPIAVKNNSLIVNDVSDMLWVKTDPVVLATVISRILVTVIDKCGNSCIRLTAKNYHNVVLFRVNHAFTKDFQRNDLMEADSFAASLGGCITLNTQAKKGNAIIFSFISLPEAA